MLPGTIGNLHELVYKQGQAGVTKASVTIVFDNSDERTSPVGYEKHKEITICRQVVINGKNKYFINGSVAQQEQVKTLFHSVQLNVNNPHFLIMQGRITKVLNMNAKEILSTIEEAAGTRMFETKKQSALKTMEKKEAKNNEIDRVLNDEITPTLDKLRMEKANYLAYNGNATKVDEPTALFSPPLVHSLLLESTLKHRYLTHKIFHFCLNFLSSSFGKPRCHSPTPPYHHHKTKKKRLSALSVFAPLISTKKRAPRLRSRTRSSRK